MPVATIQDKDYSWTETQVTIAFTPMVCVLSIEEGIDDSDEEYAKARMELTPGQATDLASYLLQFATQARKEAHESDN